MAVKIKMDPELEARIDSAIADVKAKQDEGKVELYGDEMKEIMDKHGQITLLAVGCSPVRSPIKNYLALPEEYIEDMFIPSIKLRAAKIIQANEE